MKDFKEIIYLKEHFYFIFYTALSTVSATAQFPTKSTVLGDTEESYVFSSASK